MQSTLQFCAVNSVFVLFGIITCVTSPPFTFLKLQAMKELISLISVARVNGGWLTQV